MLEDYNKIIESLNVKFIRSRKLQVNRPVKIQNFYEVQNTLLLVNEGQIVIGEAVEKVLPGEVVFIPGGRKTPLIFGSSQDCLNLDNEEFSVRRDEIFRPYNADVKGSATFTSVTFDVKAFDSVNFFTSLDIPPFTIKNCQSLSHYMASIYEEVAGNEPGRSRCILLLTEQMAITMFRHILQNRMFVEKLATNSNYFKDPRLIDIFNYIKENLSSDLSNKSLSSVANVSEDYVGQYFKMLTGINPQDYIEYQRMEKAVDLLRTSKKSIREIGVEVGYKDTAYFCRRFKMMFGIPAGKMRRRETLMEI